MKTSTRWFGSIHMVIQEPKQQRWYLALFGVKLGESRSFGSSRLGDCALQEDLGIHSLVLSLDPKNVKISIVW